MFLRIKRICTRTENIFMDLSLLQKSSWVKAFRLSIKAAIVIVVGICLFLSEHQPLSLLGLALVTAGLSWLLLIRSECRKRIFFPHVWLNEATAFLLREDVANSVVVLLAALQLVSFSKALSLWGLPLLLAKLLSTGSSKNRLLVSLLPKTDLNYSSLLEKVKSIPLYNFGSILNNFVDENLEISNSFFTRICNLLTLEDILFWEKRDVALYISTGVFILLWSLNLPNWYWIPLAVLAPCFRPWKFLNQLFVKKSIPPPKEQFEPKVPSPEDYLNDLEISSPIINRLNFPMCVYLLGCHLLFVYWLIFGSAKFETNIFAILMWCFGGIGITAGAHRLWAHKSYEASGILKFMLLICNSIANQGSVLHWARDHRTHHLFSGLPILTMQQGAFGTVIVDG